MKKIIFPSLIFAFTGSIVHVRAQNPKTDGIKPDTVYSMAGKFKRSKIHFGTDTLVEYREAKGQRTINAKNIRTILKVVINNKKYYKVTTLNIPATTENKTTVIALLDYNDLHIIKMQLNAKTDSGYVEFSNKRFTGWSQMPKEERKMIDLEYDGFPLVTANAGIQWIVGLLPMKENKKFALSHFALFANIVKWKSYTVLNKETLLIDNRPYVCWKINAGPIGPPGFESYQWFEIKTGRLIKTELSKEGAETKFVSELKL
jgi:hypothetical protein